MTATIQRRTSALLRYGVLGLLLVIALFPFYWMINTSFKNEAQLRNLEHPFLPSPLVLTNYRELLEQQPFGQWFSNSLIVAICSTLLAVFIGSLGAYAIARLRFPGRTSLASTTLITYLVPPSILFIPLYNLIRSLGLGDSLAALIAAYPTFTVPFVTWTLMGFFESIPVELEEAALIDGANRWTVFRRVVLPLAAPGLVAAALFAFTLSWNEFLYALTFITNVRERTLPVGVANMIVSDVYLWGQLMAAGTLTTVPVILIYIYLQKYMVEGLTAGSVKS